MLRTDTVLLRPTSGQELELFRLALHTSKLWNEANYQCRQAYLNRQRIPKYSDQCKALKNRENFKAIGTGRGQATLKKMHEAWNAFWSLKRLQSEGRLPPNIRKVRLPRYLKEKGVTKQQTILRGFYVRNYCYRLDRDSSTIVISKTLKIAYAADRVREGRKIKKKGKVREKLGRLDVMCDRLKDAWYASIPVDIPEPAKAAVSCCQPKEKVGSIDLGMCNL